MGCFTDRSHDAFDPSVFLTDKELRERGKKADKMSDKEKTNFGLNCSTVLALLICNGVYYFDTVWGLPSEPSHNLCLGSIKDFFKPRQICRVFVRRRSPIFWLI